MLQRFVVAIRNFLVMGKNSNKTWFYAVQCGKKPGVYLTWDECQVQVKGFSAAKYKKFPTEKEAWVFVKEGNAYSKFDNDQNKVENSVQKLGGIEDLSLSFFQEDDKPEVCEPPRKRAKVGDIQDLGVFCNSDEMVNIYTDGACCSNGQNGAKAGIGIYWGPNHPLNVSERLPGRQTNNRAEIHAAANALKQAKEIGAKNVTIHTDSNFLIKSVTQWIDGWKKNNWKLKSGEPVKNKEDFEYLEDIKKGMNVKWVHVRGHQGIPGNEAADKLAVQALQKQLPKS